MKKITLEKLAVMIQKGFEETRADIGELKVEITEIKKKLFQLIPDWM